MGEGIGNVIEKVKEMLKDRASDNVVVGRFLNHENLGYYSPFVIAALVILVFLGFCGCCCGAGLFGLGAAGGTAAVKGMKRKPRRSPSKKAK